MNTPDDEEVLLGLAPAPPKLNVEAPVAGAGAAAAGALSAPPKLKVDGAVVTAGVAVAAPKVKAEAVVLAGAPNVKVELGAVVVAGAPKAGGAPVAAEPKAVVTEGAAVAAPKVKVEAVVLAGAPYAGGGAVVEAGAVEPNVKVEAAVEAGATGAAVVVAVVAPKVKVALAAGAGAVAAAPNVKVEVPVLGTLVVTDPNPDRLFGSVEVVAAPNEKLGFEVEPPSTSEPKLKVVLEAVVVAVEDVPNNIGGGDLVTDDVVEAAPNERLGGCGLFVSSKASETS